MPWIGRRRRKGRGIPGVRDIRIGARRKELGEAMIEVSLEVTAKALWIRPGAPCGRPLWTP
jgi:hypothetical protein